MSDNAHPLEDRTSVCPLCSVGCTLRYDVSGARATGERGAPVNQGGELCPKGIKAFDVFETDDRLTRPLVRKDGDLEPVSWTETIEHVVAGFGRVLDAHGPDALAFLGAPHCTNEENYLFQKLARVLGTNNVDNRARLCHDSTVSAMEARLGSGGMTNSLADLAEAEAFLVIGANPADQQPVAFNSYIRPAVNDGATLVHVDPRANATTRLADFHLAPRPGADVLVVALFVATILKDGLVDEAFIDERTTGFEAFAASVGEIDAMPLAERAGVDRERAIEAARAFGTAERGAVVAGTGVEADDEDDPKTADALLDLLLCTGNLGERGTGMNLFRGLTNEQGACDAGALPHRLLGEQSVSDPEARAAVAAEWGVEPPSKPGSTELDLVSEFGEGIRGAFVLGENPAVTKLDTERVADGLDALEFLLVEDVTHTETTAHADVVLPASTWSEKSGTVTNLDRQVQRLRALESPPGEARRDFEILCALGRRLTDRAFDYASPETAFAELTRVNPLYAGMSYEGLESGSQRWPYPGGATEGVDVLHRERFMTGRTRAPFSSSIFVALAVSEGNVAGADELVLLTGARSGDVTSTTMGGELGLGADDALAIHPADADVRALDDGEHVVVESSRGAIRTTVYTSENVRRGTVFLHARSADPLSGEGRTHVTVTSER